MCGIGETERQDKLSFRIWQEISKRFKRVFEADGSKVSDNLPLQEMINLYLLEIH